MRSYLGEPDGRAGQEAIDEAVLETNVAVDGHFNLLLLAGEEWVRLEASTVAHS